jgi:RND family efflux transporter MFP subunit
MASPLNKFLTGQIILITFAAVVGTVIYLGLKPPVEMPEFPPPVVSVAVPERRDLCLQLDFTGRTEAIEIADVRARVEGFLQQITFRDGAYVKKGAKLFVIDPAEYLAKRAELEAQLLSAQARLARSQVDLQRVEKAVLSDAVSKEEVTQRKAERDIAQAAVKAAQASLAKEELQLGYTTVVAPIDGQVSRNLANVGSLVGATEKTLLATVTQMDPMYVYFNLSEELLLGDLKGIRGKKGAPFQVGTGSGQEVRYAYQGSIDYIDSKVDADTGTVLVRGVVSNPAGVLLPGMFVRVRVPAGQECSRILVDERAIRRDLNGEYLLIVGSEDRVEQRYIDLGMQIDGMREAKPYRKTPTGLVRGIRLEERYIVLGVLSAQPGMQVKPVPLAESAKSRPATAPDTADVKK